MNNKEYITYSREIGNSLLKDKEDDPKYLAYAEHTDEYEYTIKKVETSSTLNTRLWNIIKGNFIRPEVSGYRIQPNDIIKIGRVVLRVRELNTKNCQSFDTIDEEFEDVLTLKEEEENEEFCKFGWTAEETEDNPKMGPCSGTGSMRYIHFKGLRHWIDSRKTVKNLNGVSSVVWKNFDCEICKKPYPTLFEYKGKKWSLHSLFEKEKRNLDHPYVILESMKTNNKNSGKVVHTLKWMPGSVPYKLGRGHEADVRVTNDISVSRLHMEIKYDEEGDFILSDLKSKFGTLVLVKDDLKIHQNETKTVQVGRTVLRFSLQDSSKFNRPYFALTGNKGKQNFYRDLDRNPENFFNQDYQVPHFGNGDSVEDDEVPPQEVIDNRIPSFSIHNNHTVMKGTPLPRNQYNVNMDHIVDGELDIVRHNRERNLFRRDRQN